MISNNTKKFADVIKKCYTKIHHEQALLTNHLAQTLNDYIPNDKLGFNPILNKTDEYVELAYTKEKSL